LNPAEGDATGSAGGPSGVGAGPLQEPDRVRLATRGSPLALVQASLVAAWLQARAPGLVVEQVVVRTEGDRRSDVDLDRIGGQGVFVKEIQAAVLAGRADVAVHSAKDLPPVTPPGLVLGAVPERADPRDALVGNPLEELGTGAVVATGSPRRRAQLSSLRPDLGFVGLRGNMATRLDRVGQGAVDAVVVAAAALDRLGWQSRIAQRLPVSWCLPQVGQGALALECRADDGPVLGLLESVDDPGVHRAVTAERAFLAALGGSCAVPVAAWAEPVGEPSGAGSRLRLHGLLASGDGRVIVRDALEGDDPDALGTELAHRLVSTRGGSTIEGWEPATGVQERVQ
jgi:hydroxymethylbilane synthase